MVYAVKLIASTATVLIFLSLIESINVSYAAKMAMVGGASEEKVADEEVRGIVSGVKPQVEAITNDVYTQFEAVKYRSQVVAGTNYFVKVQVGDNKYIHVRIFKPLPHTGEPPKAVAVQESKILEDPIEYFG